MKIHRCVRLYTFSELLSYSSGSSGSSSNNSRSVIIIISTFTAKFSKWSCVSNKSSLFLKACTCLTGAYQMWRSTGDALACGEDGADVARVSGLASVDIHTQGWASWTPECYRTARGWLLSAAWVCAVKCPQWKTMSTSAWARQTRSSYSWCSFGFVFFLFFFFPLPLNPHQHLPLPLPRISQA